MSKLKTTVYISTAFIAGLILGPVTVNAAQRVFDKTMEVSHSDYLFQDVKRYDDPDFRVKCWVITGRAEAGVSCLPWNQVEER